MSFQFLSVMIHCVSKVVCELYSFVCDDCVS